jgi:protein-S-isoprenylcysteine O-methyltransferase Ste14
MMIATLGNKVIFFGLFAGFIAIRGVFALIAHQSGLSPAFEIDDSANRQIKQNSSPISIIIILCVLAVFVFYAVWPENRNILILPLPDWLSWLGILLGIISLALQVWVHITLQKNWLTASKSGKKNIVIASGPYSRIRHPLYLALMLLLVGLSLVSGFSLFLLLTLLSLPFFNNSAEKEETIMVQQFGDEYRTYMKNAGRFFPRITQG